MATQTNEKPFERIAFGGIQRKSIKFLQESTDVDLAVNATFGRIGGIEKTLGMSQMGHAVTETTTSTTSTSTSTSSTTSSSTSTSSTTTMP